jgi:hypothetical protein
MPCYSNLVIYDQTKRLGRMDTIVGELAEKWSGRTTTATWCSSSGATSSGTTGSRSPRRT